MMTNLATLVAQLVAAGEMNAAWTLVYQVLMTTQALRQQAGNISAQAWDADFAVVLQQYAAAVEAAKVDPTTGGPATVLIMTRGLQLFTQLVNYSPGANDAWLQTVAQVWLAATVQMVKDAALKATLAPYFEVTKKAPPIAPIWKWGGIIAAALSALWWLGRRSTTTTDPVQQTLTDCGDVVIVAIPAESIK